jgi:hypothetical protein
VDVQFDPVTGAPDHILAVGRFLIDAVGQTGDVYAQVRRFVDENTELFGHDSTALNDSRVTREDVTAHNGMRTVVWQQQVDGVPLYNTILKANLTKEGALASLGSHFMTDAVGATGMDAPARAALLAQPPVDVKKAISLAAANLGVGVAPEQAAAASDPQGAERRQRFTAPRLSDTFAQLSWLPVSADSARLTWDVTLMSLLRREMFRVLVDVKTGEVLMRTSLTADISDASYRVYADGTTLQPFDSPTPFSPGYNTPQRTQPAEVSRNLVTTPALDTTASPNGWINDGGTATFGNNVDAHLDRAGTNPTYGNGIHATSPTRVFDFPLDLTQDPTAYQNAAVTQLFYVSNWYHDKLYALGFTESAGNFQQLNFGRGGLGNDAVLADAQDGSGTDNANFSTPPDGAPGRMQMYLFTGPTPQRDGDLDMEVVIHELTHGLSNRLVGGGVGISTLQPRGMGEGWSDFYAMCLLSQTSDAINGNYAAGGYASYLLDPALDTNYYFGIRRYPYTTDMTKNPLTLKDIDPTKASPHTGIPLSPLFPRSNSSPSEVHNQGEVWCVTLWEARANLVNKLGAAAGNQMILQLVTDGMKLAPANPTFLQARDAIIQADLVSNAGANRNELWAAFAKRGMGFSARVPVSPTTRGVVEAFDIQDDLSVTPFATFSPTGHVGGPFSPSSQPYTLTNIGVASLDWTASLNQPWVSITPASGTLAAGESTTVTVTVTGAADGLAVGSYSDTASFTNTASGAVNARQVVLTVKPPSSNADLASLAARLDPLNPSPLPLNPGFSSTKTDYKGRVSYTATSITVTPTLADSTATVTVNGTPVASGTASGPIPLQVGSNDITTEVTAQDGVSTKTYVLSITRPPSTDFYLSALAPNIGPLSPPFTNDTFNYRKLVPVGTTSLTLTPTVTDSAARVAVNGTPVASGTASGPINLDLGANVITVEVTAENTVTKSTYTLTVIRGQDDTKVPTVAVNKPGRGLTIVGPAGGATAVIGSGRDNLGVNQVLVSLNDGPFTPATFTRLANPAGSVRWNLSIVPENGPNQLVVKALDLVGNTSALATSNFRYRVVRPPLVGFYTGLAIPTADSTDPARQVGVVAVTVTKTGQFTGSVKVGGSPKPIPLSATFGNGGDARFGTDGASTVAIKRPNLPWLLLSLKLDVSGRTQQITGTLTEDGTVVSSVALSRVPFTVPSTLPGAYTGVFQALVPPNGGLGATDYPQGHGYAVATVNSKGAVVLSGKLGDGQAFSYSSYLSKDRVLPLYLLPYAGTGTISGLVNFHALPGSDADGVGLRWFKPANPRDSAYRNGWQDEVAFNGINVDFLGSKFVAGRKTLLGNPPASPPKLNALLELSDGGLPVVLSNQLSINALNGVSVLDPLSGAPRLGLTLGAKGIFQGTFTHPASGKKTTVTGVVFQKTKMGSGHFLGAPASASPVESGAVTITAQ